MSCKKCLFSTHKVQIIVSSYLNPVQARHTEPLFSSMDSNIRHLFLSRYAESDEPTNNCKTILNNVITCRRRDNEMEICTEIGNILWAISDRHSASKNALFYEYISIYTICTFTPWLHANIWRKTVTYISIICLSFEFVILNWQYFKADLYMFSTCQTCSITRHEQSTMYCLWIPFCRENLGTDYRIKISIILDTPNNSEIFQL